jgi:Bifunctional DNA primase/polymerase, N-terminal
MSNRMLHSPAQPGKSRGASAALLDHALAYAARGWSVIPATGKKAGGLWKPFQTQPADEETLGRLFGKKGITGLAVILGDVSGGLACRDFDQRSAYRAWARRHPGLARSLPTVQTARGAHVYFIGPEGFVDLGDAGSYRADSGHYTILPPSSHPDGPAYKWLVPLPDGPLPVIQDPVKAGLLPPGTRLAPAPSAHPRGAEEGGGEEEGEKTQATQAPHACVPCSAVDAIRATLPDGPGQRNKRLFELVRRLKGIDGLDTSPAALKAVVAEWHRRALPVITTKPFAETWSEFQSMWLRAKYPHGVTVRSALKAARRSPQPPIDGDGDLGLLAALCKNLASADGTFYLSCRTVEGLFGVGRMTAWHWFQSLHFYGVIEPIKKGVLKDRQATVWRYMEE